MNPFRFLLPRFHRSGVRVGWVVLLTLACLPRWTVHSSEKDSVESLRILSWNVRNYNLTHRMVDGRYYRDYPKPEHEKSALRSVIFEQNPDVMLLQEVGGNDYLKELSEDLKSEYGVEYPYYTTVVVEDEVRKLGILSRKPFREVVNPITEVAQIEYFGDPIQVKRGLLEVEVALDEATPITCMTFHLKSRFTSDDRDPGSAERREKEARAIRDYLNDVMEDEPGKRILLIGDLNDGFGSQAYNRYVSVNGRSVLCEIPVEDANGENWTYHYERVRRYEQIDFLFVSPSLSEDPKLRMEAHIVGGGNVLEASDHRPIVVDLFKEE